MENRRAKRKVAKAIQLIEQAAEMERNSVVLLRLETAAKWAEKALINY